MQPLKNVLGNDSRVRILAKEIMEDIRTFASKARQANMPADSTFSVIEVKPIARANGRSGEPRRTMAEVEEHKKAWPVGLLQGSSSSYLFVDTDGRGYIVDGKLRPQSSQDITPITIGYLNAQPARHLETLRRLIAGR